MIDTGLNTVSNDSTAPKKENNELVSQVINEELSEDYLYRFSGIARLYGRPALNAFSRAHFVVVGLGGVGSWVAEAFARSGIGEITLIELDDICSSNINRQIQALNSTVGKQKLDVLGQRLKDINPELKLHSIQDFLSTENLNQYISKEHNVVVDAIDSANVKSALAAFCSAIKTRLIVVGSSGGKRNPQDITCSDLAKTCSDPLLAKIRSQLYRLHGFSRDKGRKFRIDAVYSTEQMVYPKPDGSVCMDKKVLTEGTKLDCANGFGSSMIVTSTFAMIAVQKSIDRYLVACKA